MYGVTFSILRLALPKRTTGICRASAKRRLTALRNAVLILSKNAGDGPTSADSCAVLGAPAVSEVGIWSHVCWCGTDRRCQFVRIGTLICIYVLREF